MLIKREKQNELEISYLIYALLDPRNEVVCYVGITDNMASRFKSHLREVGSRTLKGHWLEDLQNEGLQPLIQILEEVKVSKSQRGLAEERERYWIHKYEQESTYLTNIKDTSWDPRKSSRDRSKSTNKNSLSQIQKKQNRSKAIYTLDELRIHAGLRVNELAELASVSRTTLCKAMRGEATTRTLIFRVATILSKRLGQEITPDMIKGLKFL